MLLWISCETSSFDILYLREIEREREREREMERERERERVCVCGGGGGGGGREGGREEVSTNLQGTTVCKEVHHLP